ncbi:MAG: hypothetical protein J7K49_01750 [Thaumarchaeota archaeon]|nr:hypothetical protein [Nitrososphaerota archaeon]
MPQLKIICLAHPATWSSAVREPEVIFRKILSLNQSSHSWLDLNAERGSRMGIYKVEKLEHGDHVLLRFISEAKVNEDHPSVEKLLAEDDCLPEGVEIPTPVPRASKALLFLDLREGVCYVYSPGMAPELRSIFKLLELLEKDTGLPTRTAKIFEWGEEIVTNVTEVARSEGFLPYKVRADLETVKLTAEGDLENNEDWKRIERTIDLGKWRTIAYVGKGEKGIFVFGLTKRRNKQISIPHLEEDLLANELFERIIKIRKLVEKALGCDVRQYCFPERVMSLSDFLT